LNAYNDLIVKSVSPHFEQLGREDVVEWIASKTNAINNNADIDNGCGQIELAQKIVAVTAIFNIYRQL
jgi:hypothetical protein